jgi:hypothetical protein
MKREDLPVYWFDTSTASKICLSVEGLGFVASSKNIAFSMGTKQIVLLRKITCLKATNLVINCESISLLDQTTHSHPSDSFY